MWTDPLAMLEDIRKYVRDTGDEVELDDDPMRRVIGYKGSERKWHIKLTDLKAASAVSRADAERAAVMFKLTTPEGRMDLVRLFPL